MFGASPRSPPGMKMVFQTLIILINIHKLTRSNTQRRPGCSATFPARKKESRPGSAARQCGQNAALLQVMPGDSKSLVFPGEGLRSGKRCDSMKGGHWERPYRKHPSIEPTIRRRPGMLNPFGEGISTEEITRAALACGAPRRDPDRMAKYDIP